MSMHITGINLFNHNVGMVCAKVYNYYELLLIYLIKKVDLIMDLIGN